MNTHKMNTQKYIVAIVALVGVVLGLVVTWNVVADGKSPVPVPAPITQKSRDMGLFEFQEVPQGFRGAQDVNRGRLMLGEECAGDSSEGCNAILYTTDPNWTEVTPCNWIDEPSESRIMLGGKEVRKFVSNCIRSEEGVNNALYDLGLGNGWIFIKTHHYDYIALENAIRAVESATFHN